VESRTTELLLPVIVERRGLFGEQRERGLSQIEIRGHEPEFLQYQLLGPDLLGLDFVLDRLGHDARHFVLGNVVVVDRAEPGEPVMALSSVTIPSIWVNRGSGWAQAAPAATRARRNKAANLFGEELESVKLQDSPHAVRSRRAIGRERGR